MAITMYDVSIPVFKRALHNLSTVLEKGESHAKAKGAVDNLLHQRLIIDMFPLTKQIQVACDTAARSAARMAGTEAKAFSDTETTFEQARDRIARTIADLDSFKPEQINAAEGRHIARPSGKGDVHDKGLSYLTEYALPNFFFQLPLATRSSGFAASVTTAPTCMTYRTSPGTTGAIGAFVIGARAAGARQPLHARRRRPEASDKRRARRGCRRARHWRAQCAGGHALLAFW
jgi:hypothetical protein